MVFNSAYAAPPEESAPSLPTALFLPLLVVGSVTSLLLTFNVLIYFCKFNLLIYERQIYCLLAVYLLF